MIINVVIANDDTPMSIAEIYLKSSIVSFLKFPSFSSHVYRMMRELNKWIFFRALYLSLSSLSLSLPISISLCIWLYLWLSAPLSKYTQYNFFIWCIKIMGWKLNLIIDELNIVLKLVLHINLFHIDKLLVIYLILVLVFRMALLLLHSDLWKVPQCRIRCDFF